MFLLVATFAVVATIGPAPAARRSRSSRGTDAATQYARAVEAARKGQVGSALLAVQSALRQEPETDRFLYLAALLSYKQAHFEPAVSYCSRLLALRTPTSFGDKAASLKALAEGKLSAGRGSAARASLEAPTVLYSSALENQRRFVDEGLSNVAGRVRQSVRGGLTPVDERPVVRSDAYPIVTGQKRLMARATAVVEPRPAAAPPTPAPATPSPSAEALAADAASALDALDFGDALPGSTDDGTPDEPADVTPAPLPATPPPPPSPTPVAAAPATAPVAVPATTPAPEPTVKPTPEPTKAVAKPATKPAGDDDFGDAFAGFGDDSTPSPAPTPTKAPTKKPVAKPVAKPTPAAVKPEDDFGDAFDGFGDDGASAPPAATRAPAAAPPAATKAPAATKDDADDDFGDAFDGF
jgi:hypothetical protein